MTAQFFEISILEKVRRTYGPRARAVAVNQIFIPKRGWKPSLFSTRFGGSLRRYLQNLSDTTTATHVNLRVVHDGFLGVSNPDYSLEELRG